MIRLSRGLVVLMLVGFVAAPSVRAGDEEGEARKERRERVDRERDEPGERREREHREHEERPERPERDRPARISEEAIIEFVRKHRPDAVEHLRRLRAERPEVYREELREIHEHMQEFRELREQAPDVAEALMKAEHLERESEALAEKIRDTRDPRAREEMIVRLRKTLNAVFELRLKRPELEIRHMMHEIEEIKRMIERRREARERIVERRLRELVTNEEDELGWW